MAVAVGYLDIHLRRPNPARADPARWFSRLIAAARLVTDSDLSSGLHRTSRRS